MSSAFLSVERSGPVAVAETSLAGGAVLHLICEQGAVYGTCLACFLLSEVAAVTGAGEAELRAALHEGELFPLGADTTRAALRLGAPIPAGVDAPLVVDFNGMDTLGGLEHQARRWPALGGLIEEMDNLGRWMAYEPMCLRG